MTDADPHALTMQLYDGELDREGELAARAHLAGCAQCQRELEDLMGLDAALDRPRAQPAQVAPAPAPARAPSAAPAANASAAPARSRRWVGVVALVAAAAAAVLVIVLARPSSRTDPAPPALALGPTRGLEVRWSAPEFAAHRPYAVARGGAAAEAISLDDLAGLERRGDRSRLVAAAASAGDRARAKTAAAGLPDDPDGRADRAALALTERDPVAALEALGPAEHDTAAGAWNRALALRELDLIYAAEVAFTAIGARGEPGWADEAGARADALVPAIERRGPGFVDLRTRGAAMVAGTGPALTAADARAYPAYSRAYLLDALRVGVDRAQLAPLADALDALAGDGSARAALERAAARDPAARAKFVPRYRQLAAGTLAAADAERLVDELLAAGPAVDDLAIGAIIATRQAQARLDALAVRIERDGDPWYRLLLAHERAAPLRERDPVRMIAQVAPQLAACPAGLTLRCGELAMDLALAETLLGEAAPAERHAAAARRYYADAGVAELELRALALEAEAARYRGQVALAAALFDELVRRSDDAHCANARYAQIGLAEMALAAGDRDGARRALPRPDACAAQVDAVAISTAVDLARQTGRDDDRALAEAWLARPPGDDPRLPAAIAIGAARLLVERDPAAGDAALAAAIEQARPGEDPAILGWAWSARISGRAAAGAWAAALDDAAAELHRAAPPRCAVALSSDDDRLTVAVRGADGTTTGSLRRVARAAIARTPLLDDALLARLDGCEGIPVFARAPLHGRADVLPAARPWSFVSGAPPAASALPPRVVIVADPVIPPGSDLPRLAPPRALAGATTVTGADATPRRVLAELADATYAELHVHGVVDLETSDASYLALSPGPDGAAALTAGDLRTARLRGAPIVVLAACRASARVAHLHARWSLPEAFRAAGARAVIAADVDLPDAEATALFDRVRVEVEAGATPAAALATARTAFAATPWAAHVMLFE